MHFASSSFNSFSNAKRRSKHKKPAINKLLYKELEAGRFKKLIVSTLAKIELMRGYDMGVVKSAPFFSSVKANVASLEQQVCFVFKRV